MKLAAPLAASLVLSSVIACGAPSSGQAGAAGAAPPAGPGAGDSPAARCLAIAGAKRERRPDEPARITAKHVLVKYAGAKNAAPSVSRSREDACLRAEEARAKLASGASFAEVVAAYSEEPGASTREGSVGSVGRGDVVPAFADAAFELRPGEVSHVVETPFGFHVVLRAE